MSTPVLTPIAPVYLADGLIQPQPSLCVVGFRSRGDVVIDIPQLGGATLAEVWFAQDAAQRRQQDGITIGEDGHLLFGALSASGDLPLETAARDVYARAIGLARSAGYPHFIRMWNHLGAINAIEDGRERYQRFCVGRHEAFEAAGYTFAGDLPAASAVGMDGEGLVTYFLAAREPGMQIENPRQVAAYCYPRQYGPKSPSFSRATIYRGTVFVSGTASVVGHESVHIGDVGAQLDETLRNIEIVLARAIDGGTLENIVALKTYVRHADDYALVAERLEAATPPDAHRIFLRSDICRADLLLEIEAIARVQ